MATYIKKKIAFRFEVSKKIGYGHFMRCLSIAEKLNKKYSFDIYFIVNKEFSSNFLIQSKRINVIHLKNIKNRSNEEKSIQELLNDLKINSIFFDIKKNYSNNFIKKLHQKNVKIITIDDKYNKRIHSHVCFYPPVPQVKMMNWSTFKGKKFIGWQYIPLRKQFENIKNNKASSKKILILSGGSNSRNFTYQILRTINHFKKRLELVILLNFKKILDNNLKKIIKSSPHKIKIIKSKYYVNKLISESSIIISPFGVSVYEIVALQKYPIIFTYSKDDEISASIFHKANIGYSIRNTVNFNEIEFNKVINKYQKYLLNKKIKYSKYIRSGTEKIAKIINETIKNK